MFDESPNPLLAAVVALALAGGMTFLILSAPAELAGMPLPKPLVLGWSLLVGGIASGFALVSEFARMNDRDNEHRP